MKNTQNTTKRTDLSMTIPSPILEGSGIAEAKCAELHQLRHCVAVLQGKMTTYELIEAIESISGLAESLTTHLADVCGICGGCDASNETLEGEQEIKIPPELLDELNIPRSAKLEAYPRNASSSPSQRHFSSISFCITKHLHNVVGRPITVNFIIEVLSIYLVIETMRVKRRFKLLIQLSLIFICRKRDCFDRA